tara:strand:- start:1617 stop:2282 length:666 start_codon:yes stop_codon:yes gene_type:complete
MIAHEIVSKALEPFNNIDWDDMHTVNVESDRLLRHLNNPSLLRELVLSLYDDERLQGMCEHFDHFDKLVLHKCEQTDTRLRMHIFGDKFVEEAHNHRHCFSSYIIRGEYIHYIHGSEDAGDQSDRSRVQVPIIVQHQLEDSCYSLHHSAIHSNYAEPNTISLVLAGPAKREYFRIVDKETGEFRIRYGNEKKPGIQEKGEARVGKEELDHIVEILEEKEVI